MRTMLPVLINEIILCEGGGNYPAAAVPLVALGTQSGTIDVVDVSANAVASSLSVHNGIVRGLRWLGNSRLVSFSYTQVYNSILMSKQIFLYVNSPHSLFLSVAVLFSFLVIICILSLCKISLMIFKVFFSSLFNCYAYAFGLRLMKNPEDILTS